MLHIDVKRIRKLRLLLDQICYDIVVNNVAESAIKSLPKKTRLFIQLFHLNKKLQAANVKNILGPRTLDDLLKLGLLISKGKDIEPRYAIASFRNYYFIHDYEYRSNDYAYLESDSYILAGHLPFNFNATSALDLCSGTGIQAILLAKNAKKITGVELSPLTVDVAHFNVFLNNVENKIKILRGNLYGPVKNKKFDLIVANPPFIPIPDTFNYPLCGRGGEDGLFVLKDIFSNISDNMTRDGIGLILGITFGSHRYPFIFDLLKIIAKRDKLDIDVLVLECKPKWQEIHKRALLLLCLHPNPELDPEVEMRRIYNKGKAEKLYTYLVKLKRGKGNVKLIGLCDKNNSEKKTEKTANYFLLSLREQVEESFINRQYIKAISMLKNMETFTKTFGLKYLEFIPFKLGNCYKRLEKYKEAIVEFKKAEKINSKKAVINFLLAQCYRMLGNMKQFNKELNKAMFKFKHLKRK